MPPPPIEPTPPPSEPNRRSEVRAIHTGVLRVTLEAEHARAYWVRARPDLPPEEEAKLAFAGYWFGAKSMARVRSLLATFRARFAAYPEALAALNSWRDIDRDSRDIVCHWHVQLTDPIYRRFTGEYLPERRMRGRGDVTRDAVLRWITEVDAENRWTAATRIGFASKLLSVAYAAGLLESNRDPRPVTTPRVPPKALSYLLYLLRSVAFTGSLHDNAYLRSVGHEGGVLEDRLRAIDEISFRRIGDVVDFDYGSAGSPIGPTTWWFTPHEPAPRPDLRCAGA